MLEHKCWNIKWRSIDSKFTLTRPHKIMTTHMTHFTSATMHYLTIVLDTLQEAWLYTQMYS